MNIDYQLKLHKKGLLNRIARGEALPFSLKKRYDEDSIGGDNFKGFMKQLKRVTLMLKKKLKDNEPLSDNFDMHLSFISHFAKNAFKYYPMVLDLEDGQQLIGLARQYGDKTSQIKLDRDSEIKITKWFLNGVEITSEVFTTRETVTNPSEEINSLAKVINTTSARFQRFNLQDLRAKIKEKKALLSSLKEELKNITDAVKEDVKNKEVLNKEVKEMISTEVSKPKSDEELLDETKDIIKPVPTELQNKIYLFLSRNEFFKDEEPIYRVSLAYTVEKKVGFDKKLEPIYKYMESKGYDDIREVKWFFKFKDDFAKEILKDVDGEEPQETKKNFDYFVLDLNTAPTKNIRGKERSRRYGMSEVASRVGKSWSDKEKESIRVWLEEYGLKPIDDYTPQGVPKNRILFKRVKEIIPIPTKADIKRQRKEEERTKSVEAIAKNIKDQNKETNSEDKMEDFTSVLNLTTIDAILDDKVKETLTELTALYGKDEDKYVDIYRKIQAHIAEIATKGV